ncbi:cysteine-rich receptor-like protein kinase 5 [Silene latifolia]|uniref:cysteine-rich receptor-like protein kinase 5 n=1 Tax=Silene latifolia TaxID=37657 RepID=UPI003D7742DF
MAVGDYLPIATLAGPKGNKMIITIAIAVAVVVLVILLIVLGIIIIRKRKSKSDVENCTLPEPNIENNPRDVTQNQTTEIDSKVGDLVGIDKDCSTTLESLYYDFADIQAATDNFARANKIGRGGSGIVYKGTLQDGQQIAVKRLSNGSDPGDKEFKTEVAFLAKLQHTNLVRLLGFSIAEDEALLVYEFVANKSLDYFIFDSKKRAELNWSSRFEIIKGIAQGMMYLHEDSSMRTMHRDLKAGNILLDSKMCPKIADFGLARICGIGQTHINPTQVVGTHGYMAPEYLFHGQFSAKSDVYAMGVLILEIVSGRRISGSSFHQPGGEGLISFAWRCWEDENPLEIMDPELKDSFSRDEAVKCVQLGLLCVQEDSNLRPTMSIIVHTLNADDNGASLSVPQHPPFVYSGGSNQSNTMSSNANTNTN